MVKLTYDPADNEIFWAQIRSLPGFPVNDDIPLRQMVIESGAVFRLSEIIQSTGVGQNTPLLTVMDPTPMRREQQDLKALVMQILRQSGWEVETLVLKADEKGQVHTDMPHIQAVKDRLTPDKAVVSIGSGVVTDITKHACHLFEQEAGCHVPYLVFQTANSVSAYTSNMAPVFVDGVKRTLPSRYPDALVCDLETLRDAPHEMTVSGVGDLLAVFVSLPDWHLAHQLGFAEDYNPLPELLMGPLDKLLLQQAGAIRAGDLDAVALLAKLITLGGLAMSLTHATTPLSGYEHVISHTLDLQSELTGKPYALHGTQVALTSILCTAAYQYFFDHFQPASLHIDDCYPAPEVMEKEVRNIFDSIDPSGKAGEECWSDYHLKLQKWGENRQNFEAFLQEWPVIKEQLLLKARPPELLKNIFSAVEGPASFAEMQPPADEETVKFAFLNAPLLRKRLTLGDLFIYMQWDRDALWQHVWRSL